MPDKHPTRTKMVIGSKELAEALTYWLNQTRFRPEAPVKVMPGLFVFAKDINGQGVKELTLEYDRVEPPAIVFMTADELAAKVAADKEAAIRRPLGLTKAEADDVLGTNKK